MPVSDAAIEGVAGSVGAVLSLCATYPLLTVSTLRALQAKEAELEEGARKAQRNFNPLRDVVECVETSGWKALFAGLKPAIVATAVSQGIYFYMYSLLRQAVVRRKVSRLGRDLGKDDGKSEDIGVASSMLVAGVAGCVNVVATNPLWVIITQMQALQKQKESSARNATVSQLARTTYTNNGIAGFFKGVWPSMIMVSNPTIQYILYESLVAQLHRWRSRKVLKEANLPVKLNASDIFLVSALAKVGATLATYPILVVKSRLQSINTLTEKELQYTGLKDAIVRMWQNEGLAGFFKGMKLKMMQTVLAAALLMVMKEELYAATRMLMTPKKYKSNA